MPLIGYLVGNSFYEILENYFGYISFAILAFLGGKMIYEHFKNSDETQNDIITFKELVFLGIATSIDALAAGFIFAGNNILEVTFSCLIIGITTFIICFFGYFFGCKAGRIIGDKGEIFGGIVLIILGIKFLVKCF